MLIVKRMEVGQLHPKEYYWGSAFNNKQEENEYRLLAQGFIDSYGLEINRKPEMRKIVTSIQTAQTPLSAPCIFVIWVEENEFGLVMP